MNNELFESADLKERVVSADHLAKLFGQMAEDTVDTDYELACAYEWLSEHLVDQFGSMDLRKDEVDWLLSHPIFKDTFSGYMDVINEELLKIYTD